MGFIGLVPARGGSKSIPKKSIASCAGRPLLSYTCEAAAASRRLDRTILSTDDPEIAEVGRSCGLEVPFLRPAEIAADDTPMAAVLAHALDWLEREGESVTAIVLLQPTSPLRTARHIDEAIALFESSDADTVVSIVEVPHQFNPVSVVKLENGHVRPFLDDRASATRRQDKPEAFARNGPAVLVVSPATIREGALYGERTVGYLMAKEDSLDVDDPMDLKIAGYLLAEHAKTQ